MNRSLKHASSHEVILLIFIIGANRYVYLFTFLAVRQQLKRVLHTWGGGGRRAGNLFKMKHETQSFERKPSATATFRRTTKTNLVVISHFAATAAVEKK